MTDELVCWKCGASLEDILLPIARTDHCNSCGADLHVCRLCRFYNPRLSDGCDEPLAADGVTDAGRANFCDYLSPKTNAYVAKESMVAPPQSQAELEALFGLSSKTGDSSDDSDEALQALRVLFKDPDNKQDE